MSDRNRTTFRAQELRLFVQSVFERLEVPTEDAAKAAEILVSADLRGIDSHGVARLHSYVGLLEIGRIKLAQKKTAESKARLNEVIKRFPKTREAMLARRYLEKIR